MNENVNLVQLLLGLSGSSAGKESAFNVQDPSSIPGSGRSARAEKLTDNLFPKLWLSPKFNLQ